MQNITGLQVALVGLVGMVLRHFRVVLPENELMAFIVGAMTLGGIVWTWIGRYRKGEISFGGFKRG